MKNCFIELKKTHTKKWTETSCKLSRQFWDNFHEYIRQPKKIENLERANNEKSFSYVTTQTNGTFLSVFICKIKFG